MLTSDIEGVLSSTKLPPMKYVAVLIIGIISLYVFVRDTLTQEENGTLVLSSKTAPHEPPISELVRYPHTFKEVSKKEDVGTLVSYSKTERLVVFLHPRLALSEQPMFGFVWYPALTAEKVYRTDLVPHPVAKNWTS